MILASRLAYMTVLLVIVAGMDHASASNCSRSASYCSNSFSNQLNDGFQNKTLKDLNSFLITSFGGTPLGNLLTLINNRLDFVTKLITIGPNGLICGDSGSSGPQNGSTPASDVFINYMTFTCTVNLNIVRLAHNPVDIARVNAIILSLQGYSLIAGPVAALLNFLGNDAVKYLINCVSNNSNTTDLIDYFSKSFNNTDDPRFDALSDLVINTNPTVIFTLLESKFNNNSVNFINNCLNSFNQTTIDNMCNLINTNETQTAIKNYIDSLDDNSLNFGLQIITLYTTSLFINVIDNLVNNGVIAGFNTALTPTVLAGLTSLFTTNGPNNDNFFDCPTNVTCYDKCGNDTDCIQCCTDCCPNAPTTSTTTTTTTLCTANGCPCEHNNDCSSSHCCTLDRFGIKISIHDAFQ